MKKYTEGEMQVLEPRARKEVKRAVQQDSGIKRTRVDASRDDKSASRSSSGR